jgi:hypothetical protein
MLVSWTSEAGENYDELEELYESVVGQWELYLSHSVREVGGVYETHKTYEQDGPVYEPVPAEKQREALQFLNEQAFQAPERLIEADVLRRIEASGALERVREAQVGALELLLQPERMARLLEAEAMSEDAYTLGTMLGTVRDGVWNELDAGAPVGPYRRNLQRGYLARMDHLMTAEVEAVPNAYGDFVVETPVNVRQSDIRAYVRGELTTVRDAVEQALRRTDDEATRMHLEDVRARIDDILEGDEA